MALRISTRKLINKSPSFIYKHNIHRTIFTKIPISCIATNRRYFSTQDKDDSNLPRTPRKLVMSPTAQSSALSGDLPHGFTTDETQSETIHKSRQNTDTQMDDEPLSDPIASSETEHKSDAESDRKRQSQSTDYQTKTYQTKAKKSKQTKLTKEQYAYNILNEEILETPKKPHEKYDIEALSDEEQKLYKVVQHLINEGFIDDIELLNLSDKHKEIEKRTNDTFNQFEREDVQQARSYDVDDYGLNAWRDKTIQEMESDIVYHKSISMEPLLMKYKRYDAEDMDTFYELHLDSRDLKHILLYLIYNHLHTKRFYELNPSIKELANLLYGIKTQSDFNRLLNVMSRTRKQIINMLQSYPRQSAPNIVPMYDTEHDLEHKQYAAKKDEYKYDEYGQNIEQNLRNMTSFELDTTIKRIQDLEFRQFGYTQPEPQGYDESDEFINIVQNEDEADAETAQSAEEVKKEISADAAINEEDETQVDQKRGYYSSVMDKVQQRWNGDIMDMKYVGGDWRVRLGIAERAIDDDLDVETEVEKQYRRQLNESIAYTTRKRYKISPWTIRSLPYTEAKELDVNFTNVKLLNKFVNDRGMILPRRFTGVDKKTQKRIAKAIKRARKIGFMPHMSKLLLLDKDGIKKRKRELEIKKFVQNEREEYDMMNMSDLKAIYPDYAPNDEDYETEMNRKKESNLEMDFDREYEIDDEELFYQNQLRKQQNIFMRQIKQDIVKKIPEYWQKRLSFRDRSNQLVKTKQKQATNALGGEKKTVVFG